MAKQIAVVSPLRLVKWCAQWQPMNNWPKVPQRLRGIYVLHNQEGKHFNVVYVGMAASGTGIMRRLRSHARPTSRKKSKWTHFSMFVVWENIRNDEISELESLFREIYRKDAQANSLNKQRGSRRLREVRRQFPGKWYQP
jgi:hypothetical protein